MQNLPALTADMVRSYYPAPTESGELGGYCVGGALCAMVGGKPGFPCEENLAEALMTARPSLGERDAMRFARVIIEDNDEGRVDSSWDWLDIALRYGGE